MYGDTCPEESRITALERETSDNAHECRRLQGEIDHLRINVRGDVKIVKELINQIDNVLREKIEMLETRIKEQQDLIDQLLGKPAD